jgi:glycine/D-amino acid oxidase-like deaminating enzyme/nitrite reductase/ring-hydroxylating ferredoxin subunit
MKTDSGKSVSPWMADFEMPPFAKLAQNIATDICIIGAGITGISTAYLLGRQGRSVVVIDDGEVGGGETGRTTAHLVNALDDRFYELERLHGERGAQLAAESHSAAINQVEEIVHTENLDCDFLRLDGYLFGPPQGDAQDLERELKAAHRAGLTEVELMSRAPLPFDTGPALRFPRQAQFHPLKYLRGLAQAIERNRGKIFTGTHAQEVTGGDGPEILTRTGFRISAQTIIVATNTPINDRLVIHTKQAPYRTYVVAFRVPKGAIPMGLYWDTMDPYHYIRLQRTSETPAASFELLAVGGEDHKTGQPEAMAAPFGKLEAWVRERFPMAAEVEFRWSGQVMEPVDSLAFIGQNPLDENVYIATGDSGNGMTHGTIAAMLISDMIAGRQNEWEKLYDPRRRTLRAAPQFARENLNVAVQYGDWATHGEVSSEEEIPLGDGAIVRHGLTKRAVYRDDLGKQHICSAVCPHLGGVVRWNSLEKTWDCPCHGSRFDRFGNVVNGPAIEGLQRIDEHVGDRFAVHHEGR